MESLSCRLTRYLENRTFWRCLTLTLLLLFLPFYWALASRLPFDLTWDMDLFTVNDALSMNSGQFPTHIDHPKFGMHLLASWSLAAGRALGWVSAANFTELAQAPSPLLVIAEIDLFLRRFEALGIWLSFLLALGLLWRLFPRQRLLPLLAIPLLGLQMGMIYCSMAMRTEACSIFFLLLGLFLFVVLAQAGLRQRRLAYESLAWLAGGFCFGLALLTKLQAIVAMPFFLGVCAYLYARPEPAEALSDQPDTRSDEALTPSLRRGVLLLFGLSLLMWGAVAVWAWQQPTLPGAAPVLIPLRAYREGNLSLGQFLAHLKLQLVWLLLLASPLVCLLLAKLKTLRRLVNVYPLFWVGLFAAFGSPWLAYAGKAHGLSLGWTYLLQMIQSCLWTDTNASTTSAAGAFLPTLEFLFATDQLYLLLALTALAMAGFQLLTLDKAKRKSALILCLVIFFSGVMGILFGSRPLIRDTIWFKFLGSLSTLILIGQILPALSSILLRRVLLLLVLLLPLCAWWSLPETLDQIHWYYAKFVFSRYGAMADAVWTQPGMGYPATIARAYGTRLQAPQDADLARLRQAVAQARQAEVLKTAIAQHFIGAKPPLRALGLAEAGFAVWNQPQGWARFTQIAPELRGSTLINLIVFESEAARQGRHELRAIWDPELLLCLSRSDYQRLFQLAPQGPAPLTIRTEGGLIAYYPITLGVNHPANAASLATYPYFSRFDFGWFHALKSPAFLLLRQSHADATEYPNWPDMEFLLELSDQTEKAEKAAQ